MDETEIQAKLQQNIPKADEPTTVVPAQIKSDPELTPVDFELDEITQYKLHQHFGEDYKEGDQVARQQLGYIYQAVSDRAGTKEYPFVVAKINELKRMLGLNYTDNSRYKLYQWLKLDQNRTKIEQEMNNVKGAF